MAFRTIAAYFTQKRPLPAHRAYWREVPFHRLTSLLIAIFCLFGMLGCFTDLLDQGRKPYLTVVAWSLWSGLIAVLWILAYFRDRRWLLAVIVFWLLGSRLLSAAMHHLGPLPHPTPEQGTRVATIACMVLSFSAYLFFMGFMQREGTRAVRIQTELSLAQGIQKTLVPVVDYRSDHVEVYGVSIPSTEVGGDLVDLVSLPDGALFAYVADVSGHGLPAGILMGMIKTAVRTQLVDLPSPAAVFDRLNQVLPAVKESHMYATATALRIYPVSNDVLHVDCSIAGHPAMLHAGPCAVERISDQQLPLGLLAGPAYRGKSLDLQPGDLLLIATDGIIEATDKSGNEFGFDRLESLLRDSRSLPFPALANKINSDLTTSYVQDDDQSLLLIRFNA